MTTNSHRFSWQPINDDTIAAALPLTDYPIMTRFEQQKRSPQYQQHNSAINRAIIIGSSGSGKSTLARQLGASLELPVIHLDRHFWHPGWVETPLDEWRIEVARLVQRRQWVMDGNYRETLDMRLDAADMVVFLDLHPMVCTWRTLKRRIQYYNRPRPDMARGCREPLFDPQVFQFLRRVWDYPHRARPDVVRRLNEAAPTKRVIWLRSRQEVQQFLYTPLDYPAYMPEMAVVGNQ